MAGNRIIKGCIWLGLAASLLVSIFLAGCSPKRVLSSGTIQEPLPAEETVSGGAAQDFRPDAIPENSPGDPAPGLPEPAHRGAAGTSSLEANNTSPPGTPPAARQLEGSSLGLEAAALASEQLGKPYQWGASGPEKFDCSGLVMYVYDNLGVKLPRVSGQQAYAGVHVDREDLQPGDLVFFKLNGSRIDHVGIFLGHSKFVHAPRKHVPVREDSLNNSYWRRRFKGGRRLK